MLSPGTAIKNCSDAPVVGGVRLFDGVVNGGGVLHPLGALALQEHVGAAHQLGAEAEALPLGALHVRHQPTQGSGGGGEALLLCLY